MLQEVLMRRIVRPLGSVLIALASLAALGSSSARAQVQLLTCPGTGATSYSPGLTFTPQPTSVNSTGTLGPCVGTDSPIVSASLSIVAHGTQGCLLGSAAGFLQLQWNDLTTSTIQGSIAASVRPDGEVVTVATGKVIAGRFLDDTVVLTFTGLQSQLTACLAPPGVTATAGPATLTITSL
jgi:hypothetical protein